MSTPVIAGPAADFCRSFEIRHPIVQAPMAGGWTTPALVTAVSEAGGLGMLAATLMTVEALEAAVTAVRTATDRPFGVNFPLAPPEPFDGDASGVQASLDAIRADVGLPPGPRRLGPLPSAAAEDLYGFAVERDLPDLAPLLVGQGAPLAVEEGAAAIVARVMEETLATLAELRPVT